MKFLGCYFTHKTYETHTSSACAAPVRVRCELGVCGRDSKSPIPQVDRAHQLGDHEQGHC